MNHKMIRGFIHHLENNPFDGHQEAAGSRDMRWTADMWTLEVAKCLYYGEDYTQSPEIKKKCGVPRIKTDATIKINMYNHMHKLCYSNAPNTLLVGEVGRGLDILIANMIQDWDCIYCYDHVDYGDLLNQFFGKVDFVQTSSSVYDPGSIPTDIVAIRNHSIHKPFQAHNIIIQISDGEIIDG